VLSRYASAKPQKIGFDGRLRDRVRGAGVSPRGILGDNPVVRGGSASSYEKFYAVVRRIPRGRVATYGQVAHLAGLPGRARQVGYALHAMPSDSPLPWHRVINGRGEISRRSEPGGDEVQRQLLEGEGVIFDLRGGVDLARYQWRPRAPVRRASDAS
jgi:methylated-DNA-protein-cysteine methyltransferase-like protein